MLAKQQSCYQSRPFTALLLNLFKHQRRGLHKCDNRNVKTESHGWQKKQEKRSNLLYVTLPTFHMQPVIQNLVSSISTYVQEHLKPSYLWCEKEVLWPQTIYSSPSASSIIVQTAKSILNQMMLHNLFHISLSYSGCLLFSSWYSRHGIHFERDNMTNTNHAVRLSTTAGLGWIPIRDQEWKKRLHLW